MDSGSLPGIVGFSVVAAALAALVAAIPGVPLGWLLARRAFPGKSVVEALVLLPLVLPPVATGILLLKLLGRRGPVGGALHSLAGVDVAFAATGVVVAMAVMSFPLLVLAARAAFEGVEPRLEQVAATLGASPVRTFLRISVPAAAPGLSAALLLAFARSLGEFGATMVLAGAIPGRTLTLATATWRAVETGDASSTGPLVLTSLALAFAAAVTAGLLARRRPQGRSTGSSQSA